MKDRITAEKVVGTHDVHGVPVEVTRSQWASGGRSYDLSVRLPHRGSDVIGEVLLTEDESFDNYPEDWQIVQALENYLNELEEGETTV